MDARLAHHLSRLPGDAQPAAWIEINGNRRGPAPARDHARRREHGRRRHLDAGEAAGAGAVEKAHTRFRHLWNWSGGEAVIMSRAADETGYVQPSRTDLLATRGV